LTVYRVTQPGDDQAVDVDAIGAIEGVIRAGKPGRYHHDGVILPFEVIHTLTAHSFDRHDSLLDLGLADPPG
jgi:hypothetical protein